MNHLPPFYIVVLFFYVATASFYSFYIFMPVRRLRRSVTYVLAWIGMWCERWARFRLALLLASYRPTLKWCEYEHRWTEHLGWLNDNNSGVQHEWHCTGSHHLVSRRLRACNPRRFLL